MRRHAFSLSLVLCLAALAFALAPTTQVAAKTATIVALGDSLTAGYGLGPGEGFPAQLQKALRADGHDVKVVDAGVSGDTSTGGLGRLDWSVGEGADMVIVELGANDALRGIDPAETKKALTAIVKRLKARNIKVLLAGMMAPPNLGFDYEEAFNPIYSEIAESENVTLFPFFLDGVAADPNLTLSDGMHPTAGGVAIIVENILPKVKEVMGWR